MAYSHLFYFFTVSKYDLLTIMLSGFASVEKVREKIPSISGYMSKNLTSTVNFFPLTP